MSRWQVWDKACPEPNYGYFAKGARRIDVDDDLLELSFCDAQTYLPDDLLVKVDRASMATSLEVRAPLLDREIVEFAWGLSARMKGSGATSKKPLRDVLYRHVPQSIIDRPKMGFAPPLADWLRGPLQGWAQNLLSSQKLQESGFINPEPVRDIWEEHLKGQRNWHFELWNVLMFQNWRETWSV
jgi:asparagine synthase (glutamine-hydrolysing)